MRIRLLFLIIVIGFFSCEKTELNSENLQSYVNANSQNPIGEVIACAASDAQNNSISYVFYYPVIGATDIRYYETETVAINPNDLTNYNRKEIETEQVFSGKLARFVRVQSTESWCIVTYMLQGVLHTSNPIRLKHETKPSEWTNMVGIDHSQTAAPKFSWTDGTINENVIYFQVITDSQDRFFSGTYTVERCFQYQNNTNVVLDINTQTPPNLSIGDDYNFTLMAVSEDNWVNLVIQNTFTAQ